MANLSNWILPLVIAAILVAGLIKKVNLFDTFLDGAKEGITTSLQILPALVALMTCVGMFKASGGLDLISYALEPVTRLLGLPQEVMPLALLRPISGSGAMAIYQDILTTHGPDSLAGRVASVMQGSTETTFYTIAVYFGAVGISKTRHTLPSALAGDLTGFLMSAWTVGWFFYG